MQEGDGNCPMHTDPFLTHDLPQAATMPPSGAYCERFPPVHACCMCVLQHCTYWGHHKKKDFGNHLWTTCRAPAAVLK